MGRYKPEASAQQHTDPKIERQLDEELEQTFPASDALQITRDRPPAQQDQRRRTKTEREAVR
jgi:hypothetical protein